MPRTPCRSSFALALGCPLLALALAACGGGGDVDRQGRTSLHEGDQPRQATIETVARVDGQVLIEIPLGSEQGVRVGDFFRIYGSAVADDEPAPLKATVLVKEIIGPQRCVARRIGHTDRQNALQPGDRAEFATDLSGLDSLDRIERELESQREELAEFDQEQAERFAKLREHYQAKLSRLHDQHQRELDRRSRDLARTLGEIEADHERELQRIRSKHQADLAALQASLTDEARVALRAERDQQRQRILELETENRKLSDQIDDLLKDQERMRGRVRDQAARYEERVQRFQQEIAAETETRLVLEERIAELEARLEGRIRPEQPVLTTDPERSETILERLDRITAERDRARVVAEDLSQRLERLQQSMSTKQQQIDQLETRLADLDTDPESKARLDGELQKMRDEYAQLQRHSIAIELAQLQTERAYYDLAARLMQLPADNTAVRELQQRLREALDVVKRQPVPEGQE